MKTVDEIRQIRESKRQELDLRVNADFNGALREILICQGTGCTSSNSVGIQE